MSDKTFLHDLYNIKKLVESCYAGHSLSDESKVQLLEIKEAVSEMINKCIEIQLAIMKQGSLSDVKR